MDTLSKQQTRWERDPTNSDLDSLKCLDSFFNDYVIPYIETIDTKIGDDETIFHIPIMLGGFFAYSDAGYPFDYFDLINRMFKSVSMKRYNIQIQAQFSTVDEYLVAIKKQTNSGFPVMKNGSSFSPSLKAKKCDTSNCFKGDILVSAQAGYVSNFAELR